MGLTFVLGITFLFPDGLALVYTAFSADNFSFLPIIQRNMILWLTGIIGAVLTGWGITLVCMSYQLFFMDHKWIWHTMFVSSIGWFALDTLVSIYIRAWFNVYSNILFFLLILLPISGHYLAQKIKTKD
jgi:hypothetical protein